MLNGEEVPRVAYVPAPLFTVDDIGTPVAEHELITDNWTGTPTSVQARARPA